MKIAILKENASGEKRVAISPEVVKKFVDAGITICIEKGAGEPASITDQDYINNGAKVSNIPLEIIADADIILKVQPSNKDKKSEFDELALMKKGAILIGLLSPYENSALLRQYAEKHITSFAMEFVPRITRAQSMDALSSQSNLMGYKAVIDAAAEFGRALPMMMTAAGTIVPAKVLVLGAGVAGLQAIATAKRLGAVVSAFDVRSAAKEQVASLGAKFIEVPVDDSVSFENKSGYATEVTEDYKQKQQQLIAEAIKQNDIVICTALIPGRKAPLLVDAEMVASMKPGSVIIDLAVASGGNCELSRLEKNIVTDNKVKIMGYGNVPSRIATDASKLYANNLYNFVMMVYDRVAGQIKLNLEDEIIISTLITHDGSIVNPKFNNEAKNG